MNLNDFGGVGLVFKKGYKFESSVSEEKDHNI